MGGVKTKIMEKNPNDNASMYKYADFKEIAKLFLTFKTYYSGGKESRNNIGFIC